MKLSSMMWAGALLLGVALVPTQTRAGIGPTDDAEVYAMALDPTNPDIIYVATDDGVYKTTNRGEKWALATYGIVGNPYSNMVVNRSNPSVVIMGTDGYGVYQTSNGGESWGVGTGTYNPVVKSLS